MNRYRANVARGRRARNTQNIFQDILNRTFNVETPSQPLHEQRIRETTENLVWRDISNQTDQNTCPFTLEHFTDDTELLRIRRCGHIFTRSHMLRFLNRFGHRCPICRAELRNLDISDNIQPPTNNTTRNNQWNFSFSQPINSTETNLSTEDRENPEYRTARDISFANNDISNSNINVFDISYNLSNETNTDNMNTFVNNITNLLTDSISDSLNTAIENSTFDPSNNSITFDFSMWSDNGSSGFNGFNLR